MVSFIDPIPKKACQDVKHCILCKKHGGMHMTHNTSDCCKYKKDSTLKKGLRKGSLSSTVVDKKIMNAYAQLSVTIAKLEKVSKKLKKVSKKCPQSTRKLLEAL